MWGVQGDGGVRPCLPQEASRWVRAGLGVLPSPPPLPPASCCPPPPRPTRTRSKAHAPRLCRASPLPPVHEAWVWGTERRSDGLRGPPPPPTPTPAPRQGGLLLWVLRLTMFRGPSPCFLQSHSNLCRKLWGSSGIRPAGRRTDGQTNRRTDRWTNGQMDRWTDGRTERQRRQAGPSPVLGPGGGGSQGPGQCGAKEHDCRAGTSPCNGT